MTKTDNTEEQTSSVRKREYDPIAVLLAKVMSAVEPVGKNDRNTAQNFNFRGIDAVVNAVAPALKMYKVIVVPNVIEKTYGTVEIGIKRTVMTHCTLTVQYTFYGPAGDSISTTVVSEAMDSGDKATAKAMSVAFRIALLQSLALPTDEPDPDHYTYERSAPAQQLNEDHVTALQVGAVECSTIEELRTLFENWKAYAKYVFPDSTITVEQFLTNRAKEIKESAPVVEVPANG